MIYLNHRLDPVAATDSKISGNSGGYERSAKLHNKTLTLTECVDHSPNR